MDRKIVCHKCNTSLSPGSTFCSNCGSKISAADYVSEENKSSNPVYLKPGTVIGTHYKINSVIGQGGFGITYDGTDIKLDMHVAIKEYFPHSIADRQNTVSNDVTCSAGTDDLYEQGMENFLKEAKNMAKFAGEANFVAVHDYFTENNSAYIVMEFVNGINLKQLMRQHGRFSTEEVMPIMIPVMNILEKIHGKNMIHRDVSPSNIMINMKDGRIWLLDFGAAREISLNNHNMTAMSAVYKLGYSPIEQLKKGIKQGPYTDVYALCATIYEMLTGTKPPSPINRLSDAEQLLPLSEQGIDILPAQEVALLRGLAIYPEDRLQTIRELRDALCGPNTGEPPENPPEEDPPIMNQKTVLIGAVLILAIILLGAVLILIIPKSGNSKKMTHGTRTTTESITDDTTKSAEQVIVLTGETSETAASSEREQTDAATTGETSETAASSGRKQTDAVTTGETAGKIVVTERGTEGSGESASKPEKEGGTEKKYSIPAGAHAYKGHHYYIYDDVESSWEEAMRRCIERGGYLAVINDRDENEELFNYMRDEGYETAYFGLIDPNEDGNWHYIEGDASNFRDWGINSKGVKEPNNADYNEKHVELDVHMHNGHWNDSRFGKKVFTPEGKPYQDRYTYLCEWDA